MEVLNRKQMLKNNLVTFAKDNENSNDIFSVQTDINKGYWIHKGAIYDNSVFNIKAAKKVKNTQLPKNTVYYVSTISEQRKHLFNI